MIYSDRYACCCRSDTRSRFATEGLVLAHRDHASRIHVRNAAESGQTRTDANDPVAEVDLDRNAAVQRVTATMLSCALEEQVGDRSARTETASESDRTRRNT
jgi:hypothetical protein